MSDNKTQGKTGTGKALLIIFGIIAALVYMWHKSAVDDAKHIEAVLAQDKALSQNLNNRVTAQKTDSMEDFDRIGVCRSLCALCSGILAGSDNSSRTSAHSFGRRSICCRVHQGIARGPDGRTARDK